MFMEMMTCPRSLVHLLLINFQGFLALFYQADFLLQTPMVLNIKIMPTHADVNIMNWLVDNEVHRMNKKPQHFQH